MRVFLNRTIVVVAIMAVIASTGASWARDSVEDLLTLGNQALVQQRYNKAAGYYEAIIERKPGHPDALMGLATAFEGEGQSEKAMELLHALTQSSPMYAPAYLLKGEIAEKQGQVAEAKGYYQQYIQHSQGQLPKSPRLLIKFRKWGLL